LAGDQKVFLRFEKVGSVVNRQFEIIAVGYGVLRACLDAKTAKNAPPVIYVVNPCKSFVTAYAVLIRTRIGLGFDIYAVTWAGRGTKKTGYTLLFSQLVYVQQVLPAVTGLDSNGDVGVLNGPLFSRYFRESAGHSLYDRDGGLNNI